MISIRLRGVTTAVCLSVFSSSLLLKRKNFFNVDFILMVVPTYLRAFSGVLNSFDNPFDNGLILSHDNDRLHFIELVEYSELEIDVASPLSEFLSVKPENQIKINIREHWARKKNSSSKRTIYGCTFLQTTHTIRCHRYAYSIPISLGDRFRRRSTLHFTRSIFGQKTDRIPRSIHQW